MINKKRFSVIGIGSNSVRMLIADLWETKSIDNKSHLQMTDIYRDYAGTRLFAGLGADGCLNGDSIKISVSAIAKMHEKAKDYGINKTHIFATSAVRDAKNQKAFINLVYEATGEKLAILSGEEEGAFSFMGATIGLLEGDCAGVIDIGGGSTEIIIGQGINISFSKSLQIGAVRLYRQCPIAHSHEAYKLNHFIDEAMASKINKLKNINMPEHWRGVGGTATTISAVIQGIPWDIKLKADYQIKADIIRDWLDRLFDMSIDQRRQVIGMPAHRADVAPYGIAILLRCMERLGIKQISASEKGNLDGYVKHLYQNNNYD